MTKADRLEFEVRLAKLDHYARLAVEQCLAYGLTSKRKFLDEQRGKE